MPRISLVNNLKSSHLSRINLLRNNLLISSIRGLIALANYRQSNKNSYKKWIWIMQKRKLLLQMQLLLQAIIKEMISSKLPI